MRKFFTFVAATFAALTLNAEPISVAQAIEACNALEDNKTSENEFTVEGFVVDAQDFSWGSKQQIWFMADDKDNAGKQVFQAYYCTASENDEAMPVLNGDKVQLTGKLTKYVDKDSKVTCEIKNGKAAFVSKVDGDRSKPEAESITVAQALELGKAVEPGKTGDKAYTIVGYVTAYDGKNDDGGWEQYGNQIFWIADAKDSKAKSNAEGGFEVYQGVPSEKVHIGDKVSVYTKIKNYNGLLESETKAPVTIIEKGEGGDEEEKADVVFLPADFEGQGEAWTDEHPSGGQVNVTKDGITVTANNAYGHSKALRVYKGSSFAITSEKEQIGKIVFKFANVSGKEYTGDLDAEVIVNSKEFKVESLGNQARMEKISIFFGEYEDDTPELPEGVITCAAAVELAASIQDPVEVKATVKGDAVKVRGYVTYAYDASEKEGVKKQSAWLSDKKGAKSGVLQGAYLEVTDAVAVGDYVEIEGTLAKYLKEGKDGKENEIVIEVVDGKMAKVTQGIENVVLTEKAQKVIVDGVVYIIRDNKMYNLMGAQVR